MLGEIVCGECLLTVPQKTTINVATRHAALLVSRAAVNFC